jgi:ankyrin repeat protein
MKKIQSKILIILILSCSYLNGLHHSKNIFDLDIKIVKERIACGLNIDKKDTSGNTALKDAVLYNKIEIVEFLIKKGANVNTQNEAGISPLMLASRDNLIEIAKFLINSNADIRLKDKKNYSALTYAKRFGHLEIVKLIKGSKQYSEYLEYLEKLKKEVDKSLHLQGPILNLINEYLIEALE